MSILKIIRFALMIFYLGDYINVIQDEDYYEDEDIYDAAGINTSGGVEIIDELNGVSEGVVPTGKNESSQYLFENRISNSIR